MSRYFNLQLKDEIRPILIEADTQHEAQRRATLESRERNTQIISLIEVQKIDVRRAR